ncbi:MAG: TRIC cation channel family protein [Chitinophagaceae bacterium]|nr:TRIC cation channel family protein [Chitinophagaceae bacterium]
MLQQTLPYYLNIAAIVVFAITGALAAIQSRKEMDIIAVIILGVVTAVGGGTARDVILNLPVFWVYDPSMLVAAVAASIITFFFRSGLKRRLSLLLYLDALGNALLLMSVMKKVFGAGFSWEIAVSAGVLTAIGGGLIRDVLTGRTNLLLSRELYATPILLGALLYVLLLKFIPDSTPLQLGIVGFVFIFRVAAIRLDLSLPRWLIASEKQS